MIEHKTLGKIYNDAWDAANGNMAAVACAAVARHVFTTMMAEREPAKPEAGDWAMEAWLDAYEEWGTTEGSCDVGKSESEALDNIAAAKAIREAAERHYGSMIESLDRQMKELEQERDAALAEVERLRAMAGVGVEGCDGGGCDDCCPGMPSELGMPKTCPLDEPQPASPPSPAPAATGEDELMFLVINAIRNSGCSIDGEADAVLAAIRPPFDAVRAERDGARAANAGLRKCAEDAKHSAWELKQRAEAAEAELAKRPDDRSCLTALMKISKLLGLPGIVNPSDTVKAVEAMKAERDNLAAELASLVDEVADAQKADTNPSMARALMSINIAAFRATKGKERGDA